MVQTVIRYFHSESPAVFVTHGIAAPDCRSIGCVCLQSSCRNLKVHTENRLQVEFLVPLNTNRKLG